MGALVHKLTNCNIYADGENYLGRADEVDVPEAVGKMVEHKALGMVGTTEMFAGIDKMEGRIKWNSPYADAYKLSADFTKTRQIDVRGSVDVYTAEGRQEEQAYLVSMQCQFKKVPGANFKQHEQAEGETGMTVHAIRMELNGDLLYEIDVFANIYNVGGEDLLATYRENLGI